MSDLISRQAAMDELAKFVPYAIYDESTESYTNGLTDAYNLICRLPSEQPEQKHGHWIHDGYDFPGGCDWIHCSVCGKRGINVPAGLTNFCSYCGAKMDEVKEDEAD